ncbi:cytokine receptor common subunit beta [Melanotaenia boesemani]|uniref:cytokine receptor common subunit beta n=1 Tax=Melanotaenia boesemani TaxID=1250792 RepID=UPI001C049D3B|nr:cytokine receptor common subunit beta [Melanotaenia boesemani]XP_041863844.1 cytokine receptor common subunit beta [Melanotaenia boesemani]XP_041863851.1 cytokine receptor common subunit beta [Melanotaenia boesemani]
MALFWVLLWSVLPDPALFSDLNHCVDESSSSQGVSTLLESLQCYNDYQSHVHCQWKKYGNTTMQLWFKTNSGSEPCAPSDAANTAEHGNLHCRYDTVAFGIATRHTVFFLNNSTTSLCSSTQNKSVDLLQLLRARPPVNLSSHETGDGGQRLQWSSPYPSSSSLNKNFTYQLSYRKQAEDSWTVQDVTNTSLKLERQLLLPGCRYEARVRARASVGQWSSWSPLVTWQTKDDFGQVPTLHCVLEGEREVMCSWEVSRELAQLITYQLACRHKQTALSERCCDKPEVSIDLNGMVVRYSCLLKVTHAEHLQLNLQPKHSTKTFKAYQHIQPYPPQQVQVKKRGNNWIVKWTEPASDLRLYYQVCYHRTQDQGSYRLLNISEGVTSMIILGTSLTPLQDYQVKVRSLVVPGEGSRYEGIPSKWTDPVKWTSNKATWSPSTLIYILISALVAAVFLTLYCTFPACRRKVVLWMDSVPSPGKSKILSDIKSASCQTFIQNEKTFICKVQHLDSMSACSSEALLWPSKDTESKCGDQDEGCWGCDNLPSPAEKVSDTSSLSFSGPYIFCQASDQTPRSGKVHGEEKDKETQPNVSTPPSLVPAPLYSDNYVRLPSSRSMQDLTSQCNNSTSLPWYNDAEHSQVSPNSTMWPIQSSNHSSLRELTIQDQPPEYTSETFSPWPQMSNVQASGYCHLPTAFITTK